MQNLILKKLCLIFSPLDFFFTAFIKVSIVFIVDDYQLILTIINCLYSNSYFEQHEKELATIISKA